MQKPEQVGKVSLDYTYYPGRDLYSDGEIEDKLLQIAESTPEEELNQTIAREKDWAVLYHLSDVRENIASTLPITKKDRVLEIGSGCGAVTGILARMARSVTCVDLSRKRSLVNASRHRDMDNIRILVGNFQDIEKNLTEKYDVITLIGVFEYAQSYIGTDRPYEEFLRQISAHLAPEGRIVIAIENRLGLKYWAGCREDHTGNFFEGIENYPQGSFARTFSRPELEKLFDAVGLRSAEFSYPYPDYKLPMAIYSDGYLPGAGSLNRNQFNFDRDRMILFDEQAAFDSLVSGGQFPLFANSYLVILRREESEAERCVYAKFSDERDRRYALRTRIMERGGNRRVVKQALFPEGGAHLEELGAHYPDLDRLYGGTRLRVNRILEQRGGEVTLEYLPQRQTLENQAALWLRSGREQEAFGLLRALANLVEEKADRLFALTDQFRETFGLAEYPFEAKSAPVTDLDMVAENILLRPDGDWELIDYEWTYSFPIPSDYVKYRIWHYFMARNLPGQAEEPVLAREGISREKTRLFQRMEENWQERVRGNRTPLRELYPLISPGSRDVKRELMLQEKRSAMCMAGALYYGSTEDFSEERKAQVALNVDREGLFEAVLSLEEMEGARCLRWDPLERHCCRIQIRRVEAQGAVEFVPLNGFAAKEGDEFWTEDPAYLLRGDLRGMKKIVVKGRLEILYPLAHLEQISQTRREAEAYAAELERLRRQIAAIRATKAYRGAEGARRVRNWIMARVRGMWLFRDKKAASRRYQQWFAEHSASPQALEVQRITHLPEGPKISILVPVYRTPVSFLTEMLDSVLAQTYENWEICIAEASVWQKEGRLLRDEQVERILRAYEQKDGRIKVAWLEENQGISGNTNQAAALATGDYIGLLDHDDLLAPDCLFEVASAVCRTHADVVYTDEDKINMEGTAHFDPNLKPDFSPDLLRSHNYITHFFTVRRSLFHQVGGLHSAYDGAQDYDLIFRCTEKAGVICHVPKILYYWRMHQLSTAQNPKSKLYAYEAGRKAIQDHLERVGLSGRVESLKLWGLNHVRYALPGRPLLSVIIPNKDHVEELTRCIDSVMERSSYRELEFIVVENNSTQKETFAGYESLRARYPQVKILRWKGEFNYSAINNFGARHASGEYLLLLNNDTQLIEPDSLEEMLGLCARRDVGCVGAKLLYENDTVQHAGIVLGFGPYGGFAGHVFTGLKRDDPGFMMRARITGNYCAVTAACLMVRRQVYRQVGGLDEGFAVALNDVDFCLRVRQAGYLNVFTPFSLWYHYESISRGYEDTPKKQERFQKEVEKLRARWGAVIDAGDPYYNPNFSVNRRPFTLW